MDRTVTRGAAAEASADRPITTAGALAALGIVYGDLGTLMFAISSCRHVYSLLVLQAVQRSRHWARQEARS